MTAPLTAAERRALILAPLTRGVLATCVYSTVHRGAGCAMANTMDRMPRETVLGRHGQHVGWKLGRTVGGSS